MNTAEDEFTNCLESIFRTKEPISFEDWVDLHYRLPDGKKFNCHGYQRNIAFVMADLDTPEKNIVKGTQLGLSHLGNAYALYDAVERNRSSGCYYPVEKSVKKYANLILSPSIKNIPIVSDLLKVDPSMKHAENTNELKGFSNGQNIFVLAANSPSSYDQISFHNAMQDEASRMTSRVAMSKDEEGGSPFDEIKSRMDAADYRNHICWSSPEEMPTCAITNLYDKSRLKLEEHIPCPGCGTYVPMDWGDAKSSHGMRWDRVTDSNDRRDNLATSKTAYYLTPCCHSKITYSQMIELDDEYGELRNDSVRLSVKDRCYYELDDLGKCTGVVAPKPYSVGIRQNSMYSRTKSWSDAVLQFLDAADEVREGTTRGMMAFDKKYRAFAYQNIESVAYIKHEFLMARAENYSECPQEVQAITGWWDLQPEQEYIHGGYVGWGYGEEAWILRNMIRLGSPITTNVLDAVDEMFDHEFVKPNGQTLKPMIVGIDSGNKPDPAYSKSRALGITKCIPTKGTDRVGESIIKFPNKPSPNNRTYLTLIGTVQAKDTIYERYKIDVPGPGYIHIPAESEEFGEDFYKGLVSEVKKVQNGKLQWCETGVRNEVLDWMVGNLAMVRIIQQPKYGFKFVEYTETENQALNQKAKSVMNTEDIASLWR